MFDSKGMEGVLMVLTFMALVGFISSVTGFIWLCWWLFSHLAWA